MPSYRFGFDVGTSSLGWSVLELDEQGEVRAVTDAGSRIFSDGRDSKSKETLAATRREKRQARRRRDRFQQRQVFLLDELTKAGLFPAESKARLELQELDPLKLRAHALTEKLPPHHIGRALFHINQRRGFKSNRKDSSEETTSGKVAGSIRQLLVQMELMTKSLSPEQYKALDREGKKRARHEEIRKKNAALESLAGNDQVTFGSFLYNKYGKEGEPTRARPNRDTKLFDLYPSREMLLDEFDKIWRLQARHHPDLLTESVKARIHKVIFTQRPLKPPVLGKCAYMASIGEDRTYKAMPSFQRYRIYQEVNNLSWSTLRGDRHVKDYLEARDCIVALMEKPTTQEGTVTFGKMANIVKKLDLAEGNIEFNLQSEKRKSLEGNLTSNLMQQDTLIGDEWHHWSDTKQDGLVALLLSDLKDSEVLQQLQQTYSLPREAAEECLNRSAELAPGTANLSLKAARLLTDKMKNEYLNQPDALEAVERDQVEGFINPLSRKASEESLTEELLYYGQAFEGSAHIIPGNRDPAQYKRHGNDYLYYGGVSNPTVHIALNQIRKVVNELIARYGRPASIAIELARNLPMGAKRKREFDKKQSDNQKANEELRRKCSEQMKGQQPTANDLLRLRLWEDLDKTDPHGRLCPFSGKRIAIDDLFNRDAEIEIEHLIPYSFSLDDSRANKVLCTRAANRKKGSETPHEAFGNSPDGYDWAGIFARSKNLPKTKQWRFSPDARDIWKRDHDDFLARHLNDTRYIGRMTKEYLSQICPFNKIDVITGRLTAMLRRHWGLNSILAGHNQPDEGQSSAAPRKNRDDHRHHAIDAIVVGMTTRSMLQRVATQSAKAEHLEATVLFPPVREGKKSAIDPWEGFRNDVIDVVGEITVSHRVRRKYSDKHSTTGRLHKETAYGLVEKLKGQKYRVVSRKPVKFFSDEKKIGKIRDPLLRQEFLQAFQSAKSADRKWSEELIKVARDKEIRSLRYTKNLMAIPVKDKSGREHKLVQGASNWAMEIYQYPAGHPKAGKWEGVCISQYDANQHGFKPGQTSRPHPAAKLVMRLFINDCLRLEDYGLVRVQKLSAGEITMASLHEANVDQRHSDKEDGFEFLRKRVSFLQKHNAYKVHISPSGRINRERR